MGGTLQKSRLELGLEEWVGDERGFEEMIVLSRGRVCSKKRDMKEVVGR